MLVKMYRALALLCILIASCDAVVVNMTKGSVKGAVTGNMNAFVGIPYAKPPVGNLRFAPPEEPDAWTETLDLSAGNFSSICPRGTNTTNEDCLHLSVYTPVDAEYGVTDYQVMVWIHGGRFITGSKDMYDPRHWIQETPNLIVVTINYRLGALGFLYDNDHDTGSLPHQFVHCLPQTISFVPLHVDCTPHFVSSIRC